MADGIKLNVADTFSTLAASRHQAEQTRLQRANPLDPGFKNDPARTRKAATDFEAMVLQQMFKGMWESMPGGKGMLTGSREEEMFRDMLNEEVAKTIADQQSIGVRDVIEKEMKKTAGNR